MSGRRKAQATAPVSVTLSTPKNAPSPALSKKTSNSAERNRLRSKSPLSISRAEEKDELCHLNDRLSNYISYVKTLENDKETLNNSLKSQNEQHANEREKLKAIYEPEMKQLRANLDRASNDLTKANIDAKRAKGEAAEAQSKAEKLTKEVADLNKQLEKAQLQLERETDARVRSENKCQTLKEELGFALKVNEECGKTKSFELEVISKQKAEYDSKLADELRRFRATTLKELDSQRDTIEKSFKQKLSAQKATMDSLVQEKSDLRRECNAIRAQREELERDLTKLRIVVGDLEKNLEAQRVRFENKLEDAGERESNLQRDLNQQLKEYSDLNAIKVQLDQEIMAYRKLIEGEESRLDLPASDMDSCFQYVDMEGGRKRRRTAVDVDGDSEEEDEEEETFEFHQKGLGSVVLEEVDTSGYAEFIKVKSLVTGEMRIGGWQLHFESGANKAAFTFPKNALLKPGTEVTVWNCNIAGAHAKNKPPSDYVMKQEFHKEKHSDMAVRLCNEEGLEEASIEMTRHVTLTGRRIAGHHRHHKGDEKCMVM